MRSHSRITVALAFAAAASAMAACSSTTAPFAPQVRFAYRPATAATVPTVPAFHMTRTGTVVDFAGGLTAPAPGYTLVAEVGHTGTPRSYLLRIAASPSSGATTGASVYYGYTGSFTVPDGGPFEITTEHVIRHPDGAMQVDSVYRGPTP